MATNLALILPLLMALFAWIARASVAVILPPLSRLPVKCMLMFLAPILLYLPSGCSLAVAVLAGRK